MEKKFKCQSCGNEFMADTSRYVTCPKCESDNVALKKEGLPWLKIVICAVAAVAVIVGIILAVKFFGHKKSDDTGYTTPVEIVTDNPTEITEAEQQAIDDIAKELPVSITFQAGAPVYNSASGTYSVEVKANLENVDASQYKIVYTALTIEGKAVASNETGKFSGLQPIKDAANPECTYIFLAEALKGGELVAKNETEIPGFKEMPKQTIEKMTVAEMQALIDARTSVEDLKKNLKLAPSITTRCEKDYPGYNPPTSLNRLIQSFKLNKKLLDVKVVSLGYNDAGQVNYVVFNPILKE